MASREVSTGLRELARDEHFQQRTRHIVKDLIQDSIEIALHGDRARAPASRVKERANRSEHTTGVGAEAAFPDTTKRPGTSRARGFCSQLCVKSLVT